MGRLLAARSQEAWGLALASRLMCSGTQGESSSGVVIPGAVTHTSSLGSAWRKNKS